MGAWTLKNYWLAQKLLQSDLQFDMIFGPAYKGIPLGAAVAIVVVAQAALGVWTLMAIAPLGLSIFHQIGAVLVLAACVVQAWRIRRE